MTGADAIRPAASPWEETLDDALHYFLFADRWHWDSQRVDDEPAWLIDAHEEIFTARALAQEQQQRKANRGQRNGRKG